MMKERNRTTYFPYAVTNWKKFIILDKC